MVETDFPLALTRKWQRSYAEHLFLTISLRELVRHRVNRGLVRELITARAVALLEITDQLVSHHLRPTLRLAGAEADLWAQTVRYASQIPWQTPPSLPLDQLTSDLVRMQAAWDQFEMFVGELPEDFYEASLALTVGMAGRDDGLSQLFGPRISPAASNRLFDLPDAGVGPTAIV